jgi:hypothetical protein
MFLGARHGCELLVGAAFIVWADRRSTPWEQKASRRTKFDSGKLNNPAGPAATRRAPQNTSRMSILTIHVRSVSTTRATGVRE